MKKIMFMFMAMAIGPSAMFAQVDSVAVLILDHMGDIIGDLESCSYTLNTSSDVMHFDIGLEKQFAEHEVYLRGPDKMQVQSRGNGFHKGYWYNGATLTYYSYLENNYSVLDAPPTILSAMDSIHRAYEIEFPAGDFFYPAFTDDLLQAFETVAFLGNKKVEGTECFHILANSEDLNLQVWISNDALTLPLKFVITYKKREGQPQFQGTFTNWHLNPILPDALFEFTSPPGAREIPIVAKVLN
jgi:hypothetical protein